MRTRPDRLHAYHFCAIPIARSKTDIRCLAIYTLAGGKALRGLCWACI